MKKKWYNYFVVTADTADPAPPVPPPAPPRRVIDVAPPVEPEPVFEAAVADPAVFAEIYDAANIEVPGHGYSILKVAEMLQSEHLKTLPADIKRKSILVALDAARVRVDDIVQDAVQRDRALDTYERVLQKNLDDLRAAKETENRGLEAEIEARVKELRDRVAANNKDVAEEQERLVAWRMQKRAEEDRIAEAVGYFVTENPISTAGKPANEK